MTNPQIQIADAEISEMQQEIADLRGEVRELRRILQACVDATPDELLQAAWVRAKPTQASRLQSARDRARKVL